MFFKQDPSKNIIFSRIPNFYIEDNAGIFDMGLGLLAYPIDSTDYVVLTNKIKLLLYTSRDENNDWKSLNLSTNEIAVFIFKQSDKLEFRIKLSDNLFLLSRFYKKGKQEMLSFAKQLSEEKFKSKKLSIEYVLSLFDTVDEPLFNVISKTEISKSIKPIKILKSGILKSDDRKLEPNKLNVTIGLFFDGTGNNKYNSEKVHDVFANLAETQGKLFSDVINEYRLGKISYISEKGMGFNDFMFKPKSSYLNKKSNIYELYNLYSATPENEIDTSKEIIHKIYIEGIGTKRDKEDSNLGSGLGRDGFEIEQTILGIRFKELPYGVTSRCLEAILSISNYFKELQQKESTEIGEVVLDIFGFSRGAAAARLFYRKLFRENIINEENKKNNVKIQSYKIRFYGLFDTVLSYSDTYQDDISLKYCSSPCYHIIAQNEIRENFPLTHVDAVNCVQLELYGAHSDIGGGYTRDKFTSSFAFEAVEEEWMLSKLPKILNDYKQQYAVDSRNKNYYKYFENQIKIKLKQITNKIENYNNVDKYDNREYKNEKGFVAIDNRIIESEISQISLNAMLGFAKQHNLPFNEYKFKLNQQLCENDKETLRTYNDKVQELAEKIKNQDTVEGKLNAETYFNIYNKFIHISESYEYIPKWLKWIKIGGLLNSMPYTDKPVENQERKRVEYLKRK